MKVIVNSWYAKNPLLVLLLPLSYLYRFIFRVHHLIYSLGIRKKFVAAKPVIVIGNITVGGTGKTPFTIALAKSLLAKGHKPGIITRGYGARTSSSPQWVQSESNAHTVGDEAILLSSKTGCPVVASPNRADAIQMLLDKSECDIILSDDGLQHHALHKDIEIVIVDGDRKLGNGYCLPAGPLREPISRLKTIKFIVFNDTNCSHKYNMFLQTSDIYNLKDRQQKFPQCSDRLVHAVAGIGNPERFFKTLQQLQLKFEKHIFSDHHPFKESDFSFCNDNDIILMTEKDAVKCQSFAKLNFWVLPVEAEINAQFLNDFQQELNAILSAK